MTTQSLRRPVMIIYAEPKTDEPGVLELTCSIPRDSADNLSETDKNRLAKILANILTTIRETTVAVS